MYQQAWYAHFTKKVARISGRSMVFMMAVLILVIWSATGPYFRFCDTWQLVINTGTTIITFLMVFVIQNTQNRDTSAIQAKLNEIIRSTDGAHNAMLDLEELEEEHINRFQKQYAELARIARESLLRGNTDTGTSDMKDEDRI